MRNTLLLAFILLLVSCSEKSTTDKTLVAWVELNESENWSGPVFTIQNDKQFDGISLSGKNELKWGITSEDDARSGKLNASSSLPTVQTGEMEQVAAVFEGDEIRLYINGELYSAHSAENVDLLRGELGATLVGRAGDVMPRRPGDSSGDEGGLDGERAARKTRKTVLI